MGSEMMTSTRSPSASGRTTSSILARSTVMRSDSPLCASLGGEGEGGGGARRQVARALSRARADDSSVAAST